MPMAAIPGSSCAGSTRASINLRKMPFQRRWIAGSSPAMTTWMDWLPTQLVLEVPSTLSRQLLVLHAMRDDRVLAEPAHLVFFVILEVAFEPFDMAVALEGQDMG